MWKLLNGLPKAQLDQSEGPTVLILATDAPAVFLGFGTDQQRTVVAAHPDALLPEHAAEFLAVLKLRAAPAAQGVLDAIEVLRAFVVDGGLSIAFQRAFEEPDMWGMLLVDIARHAADLAEVKGGLETLARLIGANFADADVQAWMADCGLRDLRMAPLPPPMPHRVVFGVKP